MHGRVGEAKAAVLITTRTVFLALICFRHLPRSLLFVLLRFWPEEMPLLHRDSASDLHNRPAYEYALLQALQDWPDPA